MIALSSLEFKSPLPEDLRQQAISSWPPLPEPLPKDSKIKEGHQTHQIMAEDFIHKPNCRNIYHDTWNPLESV